jgi:putative transposase
MTPDQRIEAANYRLTRRFPKHSPPHFPAAGEARYLITAACYEHAHIIGRDPNRMSDFESELTGLCEENSVALYAWCILPNHYHVLLKTDDLRSLLKEIGMLHGRTSFNWNGEENLRGRHVWHNCFERKISSAGHFFASLNYVHHNAIFHGYAETWEDWQWSNARAYLDEVGREQAAETWTQYPIKDYGKKWDVF